MKEKPKKKKLDQGKRMFLYMLPFLLLCFAFSYFPLHGWIYSFYDYKPPLKLSQCNFMGLRWFKMIFGNPADKVRDRSQGLHHFPEPFALDLI